MNRSNLKENLLKIDSIIRDYIVPPVPYLMLLRLVDAAINHLTRIVEKKPNDMVSLANYKEKERVFVIANGPSLSSENLTDLIGEDIITMNFFYKHTDSDRVVPKYHVMADPGAGSDPDVYTSNYVRAFRLKAISYILHSDAEEIVKKLNTKKNIYYFRPALPTTDQYLGKAFAFDRAIPRPRNSAQLALMLALYLGYKEIYLLGVDEDNLSSRRHVNTHFYKQSSDELEVETSSLSYLERLNGKAKTFEGFKRIKQVSSGLNARIINLNKSSRLDIFDFDTLANIIRGE